MRIMLLAIALCHGLDSWAESKAIVFLRAVNGVQVQMNGKWEELRPGASVKLKSNLKTGKGAADFAVDSTTVLRMLPETLMEIAASNQTGDRSVQIHLSMERGACVITATKKVGAKFEVAIQQGAVGFLPKAAGEIALAIYPDHILTGLVSLPLIYAPLYGTEGLREPIIVAPGNAFNNH